MKSKLLHLIVHRPILIILAVVVVTAILGFGLRHGLALNVSPLLFVEEQSQAREDYNRARASFGDDLFMVVACVSDDAFAPNNLARLRALHQQIEKLNGVADVISLVNSPYARGDVKGVSVEKLLPEIKAFISNDGQNIGFEDLWAYKITLENRREKMSAGGKKNAAITDKEITK